jgi:microcystin-dependent protein
MTTPRRAPPVDRRTFIGRIAAFMAGTVLLGRPRAAAADVQSIEPFIGEIMMISCNFPPKGWAFCNGQLLPINQNQALFSLLGTMYGGDGRVTFALPDLRARVPIHRGQGPGLSLRTIGQSGGATAHTLALPELPAHSHAARASSGIGIQMSPAGNYPARNPAAIPQYDTIANVAMAAAAISTVGGNQAHTNVQPYTGLSFVIALQGVYPPQS